MCRGQCSVAWSWWWFLSVPCGPLLTSLYLFRWQFPSEPGETTGKEEMGYGWRKWSPRLWCPEFACRHGSFWTPSWYDLCPTCVLHSCPTSKGSSVVRICKRKEKQNVFWKSIILPPRGNYLGFLCMLFWCIFLCVLLWCLRQGGGNCVHWCVCVCALSPPQRCVLHRRCDHVK